MKFYVLHKNIDYGFNFEPLNAFKTNDELFVLGKTDDEFEGELAIFGIKEYEGNCYLYGTFIPNKKYYQDMMKKKPKEIVDIFSNISRGFWKSVEAETVPISEVEENVLSHYKTFQKISKIPNGFMRAKNDGTMLHEFLQKQKNILSLADRLKNSLSLAIKEERYEDAKVINDKLKERNVGI